jgi:hypothetical protein
MTLLPCAFLAVRWYSFRSFDYLLWLRGTSAYSVLLCDGNVQVEFASNYKHRITSDHEMISGSLYAGHGYGDSPVRIILRRVRMVMMDENLALETPSHDWRAFAFGSNIYVHPHREYWGGAVPSPVPPPTIVHYVQFSLWPFIALSGLLAFRKWWYFWKATRNHPAFPVELATPVPDLIKSVST